MPKTKVEVYDKDQLIYPYIESDHVTFSNGMKVSEMLDQSISMPTVTHEDLSFKVGVGDQDVSSAIVDSSVSKMTIKGKTYQNILPEPSTHVLTNNKEMFKVNEGLDPNVEIVDGVSKSAILKGQTLVNLFQGHASLTSNGNVYTTYNDGVYTYQAQENYEGSIAPAFMLTINLPYKPIIGRTYTVFITQVTGGNSKLAIVLQRQDGAALRTYSESTATNGLHKFTFTHDYDGEYAAIPLRLVSYTTDRSIKFKDIMIIEGDWTNVDIPYFTGMTSCKVPVVTTTGKNLYNKNTSFSGWVENNGDIVKYGAVGTGDNILSDYIKINPTKRYKMNTSHYQWYYDVNKKYINQSATIGEDIAPPNNASYVIVGKSISRLNEQLFSILDSIQLEEGSTTTNYDPYKTNILSTPEEVVLRSVENAQDTINLNTGEYVERIGEYIITGNENWSTNTQNNCQRFSFYHTNIPIIRNNGYSDSKIYINCDKLVGVIWGNSWNTLNTITTNNGSIYFHLPLETTMEQAKAMMIGTKIQYVLETPTVKTVDLSTSGNWEKVVYNGTESWNMHETWSGGELLAMHTSCREKLVGGGAFSDKFDGMKFSEASSNSVATKECIRYDAGSATIYVFIKKSRLQESSIDGFKQWLKDNGLTVWYQTQTHQDSTQVKQPIFFKDGHITQSSGADNSLIPTLDYQAKTSNSYVMDLMKANTRYTMKAKSASGTFTIDGASYGAGTNGTFTSPTSMTNKLLVMSNKSNEEVMILEGDVVSKTIPYFKGIKSAFEDESKIEVLSTGKNLYPYGDSAFTPERDGWYFINGDRETLFGDKVHKDCGQGAWFYLEGGRYYFNAVGNDNVKTLQVVGEKEKLYGSGATIPKGWYALRMRVQNANQEVSITNVMVEKDTETNYEPYKTNTTKIPLLSPLRSLPNGIYDELIIDRMKNKATLTQRVGYVMLNGSEEWNLYPTMEQDKTLLFQTKNSTVDGKNAYCVSDKYSHSPSLWSGYYNEGIQLGGGNPISRIDLRIYKGKVSSNNATILREYLSKDPIVVLYELATPIITEVDLEGFPYIYKEGHIFLNSKIVPTTEIIYSINQCQQISASNEDIIRHEKELTYLQKLIAQYVQVDYESALLSLKV